MLGEVNYASAEFVYDARLSQRTWLTDRRVAGGGPVYDIGVHCLDTLRYVLQDEVALVQSELSPPPDGERTEMVALMLLRFTRGTIGQIYCSFASPVRRSLLEVTGTEGKVSVDDFTLSGTTVSLSLSRAPAGRPPETTTELIAVGNLYVEEVTRFSECVLSGAESFSPGRNGLLNQRVLDLAMLGGGEPVND
jgi:1,5-anhydro-D-fructose reductase (1,5-anhydro-D-mannitol-forming)